MLFPAFEKLYLKFLLPFQMRRRKRMRFVVYRQIREGGWRLVRVNINAGRATGRVRFRGGPQDKRKLLLPTPADRQKSGPLCSNCAAVETPRFPLARFVTKIHSRRHFPLSFFSFHARSRLGQRDFTSDPHFLPLNRLFNAANCLFNDVITE